VGFFLVIPRDYKNLLKCRISKKFFLLINLINTNFAPILHPTHLVKNLISEHAFKCSESADLNTLVIANI